MRHCARLIRRIGAAAALLCASQVSAPAQTAAPRQGFLNEPGFIERAAIFTDRRQGNGEFANGFYPDLWNMVPGAGWISVGPGYRRWYAKDQVFVDASAGISWRQYQNAQARFELPRLARSRLALGAQFQWQDFTQVNYFGEGPETHSSGRSEYRIKSHDLVGYLTLRPVEWAGVGVAFGRMRPSILPRAGWFERDRPDTRELFPADPVFALANQPTFLHRELSLTADTRDFPRHPTRGGSYRAAAVSHTGSDDVFSFTRYEVEGAHFVPLADSRVVIALHGWLVASDASEGQAVPFYFLPSLGGHNTLRAYPDYRFHDRNLVVINAEGRLAMTAHIDAALFVDAGNVAPRLGDLNLDKRSYGAGLRLHTRRQTFARIDAARGDEGWRLVLRFTDPLELSRQSRRVAAAPFVP
jgi:outer membrane protein assembly factor BamA